MGMVPEGIVVSSSGVKFTPASHNSCLRLAIDSRSFAIVEVYQRPLPEPIQLVAANVRHATG